MNSPPQWLLQWSEVVAGIGTIVLTALLVLLYKKQQEQLAAQHEAVLEVISVDYDGDEVLVHLSNFGNGVARDIGLVTLVYTDSGEHRKHVLKSNQMKRQDKGGTWTNVIRPGEENIPFRGKAKVGKLAPRSWGKNWVGIPFSAFVKRLKQDDIDEVKFLLVVSANQLSGRQTHALVTDTTRSTDPTQFDHSHSLEDLPTVTQHGHDTTFERYFYNTFFEKVVGRIYYHGISTLNRIPRVNLSPRVTDASGLKRVKREPLKRNIRDRISNLRERIRNTLSWIRNRFANLKERIQNIPSWIRNLPSRLRKWINEKRE